MTLSINYENSFVKEEELTALSEYVQLSHKLLHTKKGLGSDFLGWMNVEEIVDKSEIERIKEVSREVIKKSDIFVVVGIGGSYIGARAIIDALTKEHFNRNKNFPEIIYAGNSLSSDYLSELFDVLDRGEVYVNVISKSGKTIEPAIAFRFLKKYMENRYGEEAKDRILVTTDKEKGLLKEIANKEGYRTFTIPEDVGGRFSVLTAVGLLPIAVAGLDIDMLLDGATAAQKEYDNPKLEENNSYKYAALRNILYNRGKISEILVSYEPKLEYFQQWFRQLFAESEGKNGKGIFPIGALFTRDLHSIGQMIQEGRRNIFETIIWIKNSKNKMELFETEDNIDSLNYLKGMTIEDVNEKAFKGTLKAHVSGEVPNIIIELEKLDEFNMGKAVYFFEKSCAISGYLLGVNPFDQPGVEEYKKNMLELLQK